MAQYDAFAEFYNREWGQEYHAQIMGVLDRLLLCDLQVGDSILDVGCGTGLVAAQLTCRGFLVTGFDPSEEMLRFARENAPHATFFQGDARSFCLETAVDSSIATFEAMNHLLEPSDLAAALQQIAAATKRCFVFDMNRETPYDMFWNGGHCVRVGDTECNLTASYDPISRIAQCRTEVDGKITTIMQRYHDAEEVEQMLRHAGFQKVHRWDARRDLGMWGDVSVGRFFYQCYR